MKELTLCPPQLRRIGKVPPADGASGLAGAA
jgi:hypothetical protein